MIQVKMQFKKILIQSKKKNGGLCVNKNIMYTPIMAVIAEHLFSAYKSLNSNNFKSFKFKNIRKHLIFQCNSPGKLIY